MPLKQGKESINYNIKELMQSYEENGKIGNVRPKNKKKALKMAIAIAIKQSKNR